jgi:hypothetical protein
MDFHAQKQLLPKLPSDHPFVQDFVDDLIEDHKAWRKRFYHLEAARLCSGKPKTTEWDCCPIHRTLQRDKEMLCERAVILMKGRYLVRDPDAEVTPLCPKGMRLINHGHPSVFSPTWWKAFRYMYGAGPVIAH